MVVSICFWQWVQCIRSSEVGGSSCWKELQRLLEVELTFVLYAAFVFGDRSVNDVGHVRPIVQASQRVVPSSLCSVSCHKEVMGKVQNRRSKRGQCYGLDGFDDYKFSSKKFSLGDV